jgi:FkbM family methyltransferase
MLNWIAESTSLLSQSFRRLLLFPHFVARVKNWPLILAARLGFGKMDSIEFRKGGRWKVLDLRPGLAVLRDVYLERVYDSGFHIDSQGTILDLGANIGMFTLLAARDLVPGGRVIAIEPNPAAAAVLRRNVLDNGLSNVEIVEAAAGVCDGQTQLHLASHSLGASVFANGPKVETITVPTVNLRRVVEKLGEIELLKLDIEGSEWPIVFESGVEMWRRIKKIAMEFHLDSSQGKTKEDLVRYLKDRGYINIRVQHPPGPYGYLWAQLAAPRADISPASARD